MINQRLSKLGFKNISYKLGDDHLDKILSYDAIVVTAAASSIPSFMVEQLSVSDELSCYENE